MTRLILVRFLEKCCSHLLRHLARSLSLYSLACGLSNAEGIVSKDWIDDSTLEVCKISSRKYSECGVEPRVGRFPLISH